MVLNRNPDNFFAETEQVAFCTAHVVPGIDFTNDPLLAGRIHSYVDTQISRLGGPNFHEIPINAPLAQVHNNQRDGMHRQAIPRGRVAYEPNSLAGGCPFQAGAAQGFVSVAGAAAGQGRAGQGAGQAREVRRPLHAGHAVLQQPVAGGAGAHRGGLPLRAQQGDGAGDPRAHGGLAAQRVGAAGPPRWREGLGMPRPAGAHAAGHRARRAEAGGHACRRRCRCWRGPATARPARAQGRGAGGGRRGNGAAIDRRAGGARPTHGAVPRLRGAAHRRRWPRPRAQALDADVSLENEPGFLFDALVLPDGEDAVAALSAGTATPTSSSRTSTATASPSWRWARVSRCCARRVPDRPWSRTS